MANQPGVSYERVVAAIGWTLIGAGIVLNEVTLQHAFGISRPMRVLFPLRILYAICCSIAFLTGIFVVSRRRSLTPAELSLLAFGYTLGVVGFLALDFGYAFRTWDERRCDRPHPMYFDAGIVGWGLSPGFESRGETVTITIDQRGERIVTARPRGAKGRIFFVGDSFTFGLGVSDGESMPSVFAEKAADAGFEVRNLGVPGYGVPQQVAVIFRLVPELGPNDLVLLTPTVDDISRTFERFQFIARIAFSNCGSFYHIPVLRDGELVAEPFVTPSNRFRYILGFSPVLKTLYRKALESFAPEGLDGTPEMVRMARARVLSKGARFETIFLPNFVDLVRQRHEDTVSSFDHREIIDAFPRERAELSRLFLADGHWNAEGSRIAGLAIWRLLNESGTLQP